MQFCNNFDVNVLDLRNISHEEAVLSRTSDQYVCIYVCTKYMYVLLISVIYVFYVAVLIVAILF